MVAILLSMVTSKIVYFGFTPNYAADTFSRKAFKGRLDHDVYKYRLLSKYLLFSVDDWLARDMPEQGAEPRLMANMQGASERFYYALYYLNGFFLVLTSILVALLVHRDQDFRLTNMEKWLIIFLVPLLIGISEFTVCCYDISSYFFQLLILDIFLQWNRQRYWLSLAAITMLIILSTLNRESSALSVSIITVLLIGRYGLNWKTVAGIGLMAVGFLVTYIALRYIIIDPSHLRIINIQAGNLLIDTNIIGLFFWGLFFFLPVAIARSQENRWLIGGFFLFSLPYIIVCLKDGVLWEIRLYIPLFLGALFLSRIETTGPISGINQSPGRWLKSIISRVAEV